MSGRVSHVRTAQRHRLNTSSADFAPPPPPLSSRRGWPRKAIQFGLQCKARAGLGPRAKDGHSRTRAQEIRNRPPARTLISLGIRCRPTSSPPLYIQFVRFGKMLPARSGREPNPCGPWRWAIAKLDAVQGGRAAVAGPIRLFIVRHREPIIVPSDHLTPNNKEALAGLGRGQRDKFGHVQARNETIKLICIWREWLLPSSRATSACSSVSVTFSSSPPPPPLSSFSVSGSDRGIGRCTRAISAALIFLLRSSFAFCPLALLKPIAS
jgi:hypothetical protein